MDLSQAMQQVDFLGKRQDASSAVAQKLGQIQRIPPYEKKSTGQRVLEGAVGGATAGASVASAMGGSGGGASGITKTATPPAAGTPGAVSYPDGSYGVNTQMGSDASMPGPSFWDKASSFFKW